MSKLLKSVEPKWLIVGVFFVSGIFLGGISLYLWYGLANTASYKIHPAESGYKFINPLLGVEFEQSGFFAVSKSIELKINGIVDTEKKKGNITDASVYYRDLEPGYWAGVNENASFSPGKLLKVPLMIAYFKIAEGDPSVLEKKITNNLPEITENYLFKPEKGIVRGQTYTVQELINLMIAHSDDEAANLLFDDIDKAALNEIFSDLGISFTEDKETSDFISLKLYSLFFRVLHNATYLNREYSEKALELLSSTNGGFGIWASIPKEIPLIQKNSGRKYVIGKNIGYEVYDCGLVYYPDHPYLLCISAKGQSLQNIEDFFKNISKEVYAETEFKYKI